MGDNVVQIKCKGSRLVPLDSLEIIQGGLKDLSDENYDKLRRRIEAKGFDAPLFVWGTKILDGTQRFRVLGKMIDDGWSLPGGMVPVCDVEADSLDEAKDRLLGYVSQYGRLTGEGLYEFLHGFDEMPSLDTLDLPDFDMEAFQTGFLDEDSPGAGGEDEVPEAPEPGEAKVKPGDLWALGNHRLLCGDSTKAEDVKRVMGGEKAGLMNTDPPYGIAYDNRALHPAARPSMGKSAIMLNDDLVDEKLQQFLESAFSAAVDEALKTDAAWYLWHAHLTQGFFAAAAAAANVVLHRQIIWVKPVLVFGRGQYHWKHEPCFMGWVQGNQPPDYGLGNGERTQTTVWEIASVSQAERKEFNHSTPKPVELFTIPIVKHLKRGEVCYEPFAGSGPQFIAAEKAGVRCFGIELEPRFCDVILNRWAKYSGQDPIREDGVKWSELSGE